MGIMNLLSGRKKSSNTEYAIPDKIPNHLAIIMDGNGRWAKKRGMPRTAGHRAAVDVVDEITKFCRDIGIKYLTVYAFSTENWNRSLEEVDSLMGLLLKYLNKYYNEYKKEDEIILRVIGDKTGLSDEINRKIDDIDKKFSGCEGMIFNLAINYGGRNEIENCIKTIISKGYKPEEVNQDLVARYLYTAGCPDPDLIIRTSGEMRTSNFLLWQSAYSEYYFTDVLWPDFTKDDLLKAINNYQNRDRRFGKA